MDDNSQSRSVPIFNDNTLIEIRSWIVTSQEFNRAAETSLREIAGNVAGLLQRITSLEKESALQQAEIRRMVDETKQAKEEAREEAKHAKEAARSQWLVILAAILALSTALITPYIRFGPPQNSSVQTSK